MSASSTFFLMRNPRAGTARVAPQLRHVCSGPASWLTSGRPSLSFVMPGLDRFRPSVCTETFFTSLNLFLRVRAALHVDANNDGYPNLVAGISNFSQGQILVENPRKTCHADPPPSGGVSADLLGVVIDWCHH